MIHFNNNNNNNNSVVVLKLFRIEKQKNKCL